MTKNEYFATDYHAFAGFGILGYRFWLFLGRSNLTPETTVDAILAAATLHNLLRCKSRESYTPPDFVDELEGDQVIHEGSFRQDNAQNVTIAHTQTE